MAWRSLVAEACPYIMGVTFWVTLAAMIANLIIIVFNYRLLRRLKRAAADVQTHTNEVVRLHGKVELAWIEVQALLKIAKSPEDRSWTLH